MEAHPYSKFMCVPWEQKLKEQWFGAFYLTIKHSLLRPFVFFNALAEGKGIFKPLLYGNLINLIVFSVVVAYQAGFHFWEFAPEFTSSIKNIFSFSFFITGPFAILIFCFVSLLFVFLFATTSMLIESLMIHLGLIIAGGAKKGYEATLRVTCYSLGPNIFHVVPFVGNIVSPIWVLVLTVIGLKTVHNLSLIHI